MVLWLWVETLGLYIVLRCLLYFWQVSKQANAPLLLSAVGRLCSSAFTQRQHNICCPLDLHWFSVSKTLVDLGSDVEVWCQGSSD